MSITIETIDEDQSRDNAKKGRGGGGNPGPPLTTWPTSDYIWNQAAANHTCFDVDVDYYSKPKIKKRDARLMSI